jgi:predicted MPP superfamily phosphohydrolase
MYRLKQFVKKAEQIEIIPLGDIHYGSSNCNLKYLKSTLQYIADTPNCYMIGMGDYFDCVIPKDPRFDPSQEYNFIDESYDVIKKLFEPVKEKILCLLIGNHEYHLVTDGYANLANRLATELRTAYAGFSSFLQVETNEKPVRKIVFYLHHGWFSGRQVGSKANNIINLMRDYEADCYLVGHSHDLFGIRRVRISFNNTRKIIFANTGSFLETATWGTSGYGERAGYPPQKLGVIKLKWYPDKEDIHISE